MTIPSHVENIDFSFCDLVAGIDLKQSKREGFVIAGEKSDRPLFVERLLTWERWSGEHCTFTHASQRTVCFKDIRTQSLQIYRNTGGFYRREIDQQRKKPPPWKALTFPSEAAPKQAHPSLSSRFISKMG